MSEEDKVSKPQDTTVIDYAQYWEDKANTPPQPSDDPWYSGVRSDW